MKYFKYISTIIFIIVTRFYDAYSTYRYTPNLENEANPLVSQLGGGWISIIIVISLICIYIAYSYYKFLFETFPLEPTENNVNFSNYIGYLYTGENLSWKSIIYKIPKSKKRLNLFFGKIISIAFVYAGIISTIMWLLLNNTIWFNNIYSLKFIYSILIGGAFIVIFLFLYKEYRIFKTTANKGYNPVLTFGSAPLS